MFSDIDIAHHFGHRAIESLSIAHQAWQQASALYSQSGSIHWAEGLSAGTQLNLLRQQEFNFCADSIIFFQAMMEAIINQVIIEYPQLKPPKDTFAEKWTNAFNIHLLDTEDLDMYLAFYRSHRNPLIHPKTRDRVEHVETFRFPIVYDGLRAGWASFKDLFRALGTPHDENSWQIMCEAHKLPAQIDPNQYVDIQTWAGEMFRKHLEGMNSCE
ncbi:MAG TPA: hypothetical protein VHO69_04135 [Phototrophicaceae bacterium]|nr:hypothetical protein [Phototrophicaceae bacterium]